MIKVISLTVAHDQSYTIPAEWEIIQVLRTEYNSDDNTWTLELLLGYMEE